MATTITLSYLPPPPTSNHLDSNQKSRLIKSTRKLGQVLGTTPHLLESPVEIPITLRTSSPTPSTSSSSSAESVKSTKKFRRQGSIFQHSPIVHSASSSASSLTLSDNLPPSSVKFPSMPVSRGSRDAHRPPPLVLHLNPVVVSRDDHRVGAAQCNSLPTPLAPAIDDFPMSPMTPTSNAFFHQKKAADAKRKKVNKINRTFGETVPTELIFPTLVKPTPSFASRSTTATRNRRSMTVSNTQVWCTGNQAWVGEWNRGDIQEVQAQLRQLKAR